MDTTFQRRNGSLWNSLKDSISSFRYKPLFGHARKGTFQDGGDEISSLRHKSNASRSGQSFELDATEARPHDISHDYLESKEPGDKELEGRTWRVGFKARFPLLSFCCLLLLIGLTIGIVVVLLVSDGKDVDSWCATHVTIAGHRRTWRISVNAWIALFNFLSLNALSVMYAEAIAISWWVDALRGRTLKNLHFRWEVGQSLSAVLFRRRIWGWICAASIAYTAFSGLEALTQTASTSKTILSTKNATMTAVLANALPAGYSGVIAATGHDVFGVVYLTPPFVQVLQDYTIKNRVKLDLDGCAPTSNVSCSTILEGVGFQYNCNATRGGLQVPLSADHGTAVQPVNTVFQVGFVQDGWSIAMNALWQDKEGSTGQVVTKRNCTLIPARVEYPVNVTQQTVSLRPPMYGVKWEVNSGVANETSLHVDKVISPLPVPDYDRVIQDPLSQPPNTHSTLGGISLAFSNLFESAITLKSDVTNFGADITVTGAFAAPYARFPAGTRNDEYLNNTYPSPMDELLNNIRDIMFRSSVAVAQSKIADYAWRDDPDKVAYHTDEVLTTRVPAANTTNAGEYQMYHTVYETNRVVLGVSVELMAVALLAIVPLYWGYWRLGRKVSLAPLEVAKALHFSMITDQETGKVEGWSVLDAGGGAGGGGEGGGREGWGEGEGTRHNHNPSSSPRHPQDGSNFDAEELVSLLGSRRVRYGEVAPGTLGMGLKGHTVKPRRGFRYR